MEPHSSKDGVMALAMAVQRGIGVLRRVGRGEGGASLVEYALLLALIMTVCIGAVAFFGHSTSATLSTAGNSLTAAE
jgi:Flp pilus assembly pilin Flp